MKGGNISDDKKREAVDLLGVMRENTPREDWANNIFAGVTYFSIGSRDRGIEIIQDNIDFGYGAEMSEAILTQLKAGKRRLSSGTDYMLKMPVLLILLVEKHAKN